MVLGECSFATREDLAASMGWCGRKSEEMPSPEQRYMKNLTPFKQSRGSPTCISESKMSATVTY